VIQVTVGGDVVSVNWPTVWDPTRFAFVDRPTGDQYVPLETLGVTVDGAGLRKALTLPAVDGKVLTLPAGVFSLADYVQGDGGTFMHGILIDSDIKGPHARGIVGSGAGTVLQMTPNSSHFTATSALAGGTSTGAKQVLVSTVQFYKIPGVEFGNLTVQGQPQPHYHHGIRINGDNAWVHHVKFLGASQGDNNSPPGETYSLMVSGGNPRVEDCEVDGRRSPTSAPASSSLIASNGSTNTVVSRVNTHDTAAGFGLVLWASTGLTTTDLWGSNLGTGTGGKNGSLVNHEMSAGTIRHYRPHITLDSFWSNPKRSQGKFPHMIFLQGTPGSTSQPNGYADTQIIDPTFDTWGGIPGGFAIAVDNAVKTLPQVIRAGVKQTPTVRPQEWVDSPKIDTSKAFWITNADAANPGTASVWG
jgi:hypothetical protein